MMIAFVNFSNAQEIKQYSGPYCENCERSEFYDGKATYYYYNDGSKRIYNGKFSYSIYNDVFKIIINGNYKNDSANGTWTYKKYNPPEKTTYINIKNKKYKLDFPTDYATGRYINGAKDGKWIYTRTKENKKTFNCYASFSRNKFVSDFYFKNPLYSISGKFNDNGLFNGEWIVKWTVREIPYNCTIQFINGVFIKAVTQNEATGENIGIVKNPLPIDTLLRSYSENKYYANAGNRLFLPDHKVSVGSFSDGDYYSMYQIEKRDMDADKNTGLKLLTASIIFWTYGYENIMYEISRGIKHTEYKSVLIFKEVSENTFLGYVDSLKFEDTFIKNIKEKKQKELEAQIRKQDSIAQEKRKEKELDIKIKKFRNNRNQINALINKIETLYLRGSKKKNLYNAFSIVLNYYMVKYNFQDYSIGYTNERMIKSDELIQFLEKIVSLSYTNTKQLEKQLKKIKDPQQIIKIINA